MNKLVINTANDKLFIVLQKENELFSVCNLAKMHHNETMLPLIDDLLKEKNVQLKDIDEFTRTVLLDKVATITKGATTAEIKEFIDSLEIFDKYRQAMKRGDK